MLRSPILLQLPNSAFPLCLNWSFAYSQTHFKKKSFKKILNKNSLFVYKRPTQKQLQCLRQLFSL